MHDAKWTKDGLDSFLHDAGWVILHCENYRC